MAEVASPTVATQRGAPAERGITGAAAPPMMASLGRESFRPPVGFWQASTQRLIHNRVAMVALVGLLVLIVACFAAPFFERWLGLKRDAVELLDNYQRPSAKHWLGTDDLGRDYFIRLLHGGQVSILMGWGVAAIILSIGVPLGLAAGYFGGVVDDVFNWVVQIIISVPRIPLLVLIAALLPLSPISLALLIGATSWTGNARQARGLTFSLKRSDYVLAARAMGASNTRIMFRHIMPNMISLMIVLAGFDVIAGVFQETALSYIGFGIHPPVPSWGNMLTNSLNYVTKAPYLIIFPGLAIGWLVMCVFTLSDGLRDAFDPRLKE